MTAGRSALEMPAGWIDTGKTREGGSGYAGHSGINGFGRIGRNVFRAAHGNPDITIVAVNDITDAATLGHLLKYDSILGRYPGDVVPDWDHLAVDGQRVGVLLEKDPAKLRWGELGGRRRHRVDWDLQGRSEGPNAHR